MKKRITFYIIVITMLIAGGIIIYFDKEKTVPKVITVEQVYSYIYHPSQKIIVPIYFNEKDNSLSNEKNFASIYLTDQTNSKRIELFDLKIAYSHNEVYLHELYYKYDFIFQLPNLESDFYIDFCYIEFNLKNQKQYKYYLGEISILNDEKSEDESLFLTSLYGYKKENETYARLHKIIIEFEKIDVHIIDAKINLKSSVLIEQENNKLTLMIEEEQKLLYQTSIRITYQKGSQVFYYDILTFDFFFDYELLKESGRQIYVYAFD